MKKTISVVLVALLLSGCAARQKNITNLPAGVTQAQAQKWDTAIADLDKIAQTVSTLRQAVIALNKTTVTDSTGTHKVLEDGPTYARILTAIGKIDQAEIDATAFLKAQPQNWGVNVQTKVQNEMAIIQQQVVILNHQGLSGIKDPNTQVQVENLVGNLGSLATLLISAATS